jgi:pimeloyl-ACP methyl ester carboxylesterase
VAWPDELVRPGGSASTTATSACRQYFDHLGVPNLAWAGMRYALHLPRAGALQPADMAGDALGVLDALGIAQRACVRRQMGGMIAQHLAAEHPQRVQEPDPDHDDQPARAACRSRACACAAPAVARRAAASPRCCA